MFGSARFLFAIMIFVSLYGMAKYKEYRRDCFKKYFGALDCGGSFRSFAYPIKGSKDFGNRKAIKAAPQ